MAELGDAELLLALHGTQDVWAVFLLYIAFSKYGTLKLGRENERPEFDDLSWFAMLFSCGIGVGVYYFGVSEPMYYYRGGALWKIPDIQRDDDRAQMAIFTTLFHWGLHGWCAYLIVAIALGIVCYRWNMPLTMRSAFYPVIEWCTARGRFRGPAQHRVHHLRASARRWASA